MSQEYDGAESQDENVQDPTQNLKAEFQRKFENIQSTNQNLQSSQQELSEKLDTLMEHLAQRQQQQSSPDDDFSEDIDPYDPKTYDKVAEKAAERATQAVTQQQQQQNERVQALTELVNNYPELNDDNSELTQLAVKKLGGTKKAGSKSGQDYKLAVYEAANELGLVPKSKRRSDEDGDEVDKMIGEGGYGMRTPKASSKSDRNKKSEDLDPKTEAIAEAFGMNTKDKEVRKRLIERSKRTNWNKYQ